jgi:septal ring factor EnvC (AmiA/AmiB activator)
MKKTAIAILIIIAAMIFAGGCMEEQASSDSKIHRLIAAENRELKEKLEAEKKKRDDEIKKLETQFRAEMLKRDDDMNRLTEQLAQCEQARQNVIKSRKQEQERLESMISALNDWNKELTIEVKQLKDELANCKGGE